MKYYAVRKGKIPGIYTTWEECKKNVTGYSGAQYKSFPTKEEAEEFINYQSCIGKEINSATDFNGQAEDIQETRSYAFVDGSFNQSTKVYGYGGFLVYDGHKEILQGCGNDEEMASMRNVAGEVAGSMAAIKKAIELGIESISIYYDYMGIEMWATGSWKRNKKGTTDYYEFIQSVKNKIKIRFIKVKGHSGVEGNEEADILAKKAVGII